MLRNLCAFLLLSPQLVCQENTLSQWQASLSLEDIHGASSLCQQLFEQKPDPSSWTQQELFLAANTMRLRFDIAGLQRLARTVEKKHERRIVYEQTAWALLARGSKEHHPRLRFEAVLAAAMSGDSRAIPFIRDALTDESRLIRHFGLDIAAFFPDVEIQKIVVLIAQSGPKDERLKALSLLHEQEFPTILNLVQHACAETEWTEEERAICCFLLLSCLDKQGNSTLLNETFEKSLASTHIYENIAAIKFSLDQRSQPLLQTVIASPLLATPHQKVLLEWMILVGCQKELISQEQRQQLIEALKPHLASHILPVRIRTLWCLYLLEENPASYRNDLLQLIASTNDPAVAHLIVTHIRSLGPKGVLFAQELFEKLDAHTIQLPIESAMTLSMYLIEQRSEKLQNIASGLLKLLQCSANTLLTYDETVPFDHVFLASEKGYNPLVPRMRETEDLLLRIRLFSMAASAMNEPPTPDMISSFFAAKDVAGCEYAALQLLHGECKVPIDQVEHTVIQQHPSKKKELSFALIMALMSREERALELIRGVLDEKNIPKETLDAAISYLSGFPIDQSEPLIAPYLFDAHLSLQIRAAGSYLSSMTQ